MVRGLEDVAWPPSISLIDSGYPSTLKEPPVPGYQVPCILGITYKCTRYRYPCARYSTGTRYQGTLFYFTDAFFFSSISILFFKCRMYAGIL